MTANTRLKSLSETGAGCELYLPDTEATDFAIQHEAIILV